MLTDRSRLGIAQLAFYVPAVVAAAYLLFYRHGRPRIGWYLIFVFSLVRLAGGVIMIPLENDQSNVGLITAAIVLLSIGLMPLIIATIGLLRIILFVDFEEKRTLHRLLILSRLMFFIGIALLATGSSLIGGYTSSSSVNIGKKLAKAGYIIIAVILASLIVFQAYLWKIRSKLSNTSLTVLKGTSFCVPFLIVRLTYAFLSVFDSSSLQSKWNDLYGSLAAFVVMALIMEYIVVVIYITVGIVIPPVRCRKSERSSPHRGLLPRFAKPASNGSEAGSEDI